MINQRPPKIQFTKEGYEKLEKDKARLTKERPEVVKRLQAAREMGDLSENGMYKAARFELGNIDRKLRELNHLLRYGIVTESTQGGKVEFGSQATVDNGEKQQTFTVVSEHESDPTKHKISAKSPLGQALVGKKAGDKVNINTPSGKSTYSIIKVV